MEPARFFCLVGSPPLHCPPPEYRHSQRLALRSSWIHPALGIGHQHAVDALPARWPLLVLAKGWVQDSGLPLPRLELRPRG